MAKQLCVQRSYSFGQIGDAFALLSSIAGDLLFVLTICEIAAAALRGDAFCSFAFAHKYVSRRRIGVEVAKLIVPIEVQSHVLSLKCCCPCG